MPDSFTLPCPHIYHHYCPLLLRYSSASMTDQNGAKVQNFSGLGGLQSTIDRLVPSIYCSRPILPGAASPSKSAQFPTPGLATTILRLKSIHRRLGFDFTATRQEAVGSRAAKAGCLHHKLPAVRPPKEDPHTVLPAVPSVAGISYHTADSCKHLYTIVQQPSSLPAFSVDA